jgi:hypothetical protein
VWETVQDAVEAGEPFGLTYRMRTKAGDVTLVRERGRHVTADLMDGDAEELDGFITDLLPG